MCDQITAYASVFPSVSGHFFTHDWYYNDVSISLREVADQQLHPHVS